MGYRYIALGCLCALFVTSGLSASDLAQAQTSSPSASDKATSTTAPKPANPGAPASQTPPRAPGGTSPHEAGAPAASKQTKATTQDPAKPVKKVDLNNASLEELKTLPTVGDAEAKKIIANRPYKSKGELVTKAGLPEGVYQAVRYRVEMQKPRKSATQK